MSRERRLGWPPGAAHPARWPRRRSRAGWGSLGKLPPPRGVSRPRPRRWQASVQVSRTRSW